MSANVFSYIYKLYNNYICERITKETINNARPAANIAHLMNFFVPLSLDCLNKSRSADPTSAPEEALESGDIMKEISIIKNDTVNNIQILINILPPYDKNIIHFRVNVL